MSNAQPNNPAAPRVLVVDDSPPALSVGCGDLVRLSGSEIIALERSRQIAKEGYDATHDDAHDRGELLAAAMCYTSVPLLRLCYKGFAAEGQITEMMATSWPWDEEWWKPDNDAVRNLAKAGALIAAEIDRLQRLQPNIPVSNTDTNT